VVELADTLDLGSSWRQWGFKSLQAHQQKSRHASVCFFLPEQWYLNAHGGEMEQRSSKDEGGRTNISNEQPRNIIVYKNIEICQDNLNDNIHTYANGERENTMKKRVMISALLLALLVQLWAFNPIPVEAADEDYNLGFETSLDGWTTSGLVTIAGEQEVLAGPNTWSVTPNDENMAVLTPNEVFVSMDDLKAVMGLSDSSMTYIKGVFPGITDVSYIYRDIVMNAGQSISISWNYTATDYVPYNDASLICMANQTAPSKLPIINGYYSDVSILGATVPGTGNYSTDSYGSTGWQTVTVKAAFAGTYRLGFVVYNLDDTVLSPFLFLDNPPGTTTLNDEEFLPIDPDDNPPPMQPVISLNYSKTVFHEAAANDGTVSETAEITLANDVFTGNNGDQIADVTFANTPVGLTPSVIRTGDHTADLHFAGKATANGNDSDISNFEVIFGNGSFVSNDASMVLGADTNFLEFDFDNGIFTVKFYDSLGNLLKTESVEEGTPATPPAPPEVLGYHFLQWSGAYQEISANTNFEAAYAPNTDTAYFVEHYVPNTAGDGYVLKEKIQLAGTTDTKATAIAKDYTGLTLDASKSMLTGTISPDGSLVLSVYYAALEAPADTSDATGTLFPWLFVAIMSIIGMAGIRFMGKSHVSVNK
jgi:hypothetical protein